MTCPSYLTIKGAKVFAKSLITEFKINILKITSSRFLWQCVKSSVKGSVAKNLALLQILGVGHLGIGELGGMGWLLKRVKNKSLMTCPDAQNSNILHDI
jgi:hypothetical protein